MDDSPRFRSNGYSSVVRLSLVVDGTKYRLGKIGPDAITLQEPTELPECDAQVIMTVDGKEQRWDVFLPNGATPPETRISIRDRRPAVVETSRAG